MPEVKESEWLPDASEAANGLPGAPIPVSNDPLTPKQEAHLTKLTAEGAFSTAELIDMLTNPDKKKGYLYLAIQRGGSREKKESAPRTPALSSRPSGSALPSSPPAPPSGEGSIVREGDVFVFRGRGWGHGVGLSQWGALALANEGWSAERILEHYYPGTRVKRSR